MVIEISEKVIRKQLDNKSEQEKYIQQMAGELKPVRKLIDMRQTKVAQRYAKALFDLALEKGNLEAVKIDLDTIRNVNHKELNVFLMSPVVTGEKKTAILKLSF